MERKSILVKLGHDQSSDFFKSAMQCVDGKFKDMRVCIGHFAPTDLSTTPSGTRYRRSKGAMPSFFGSLEGDACRRPYTPDVAPPTRRPDGADEVDREKNQVARERVIFTRNAYTKLESRESRTSALGEIFDLQRELADARLELARATDEIETLRAAKAFHDAHNAINNQDSQENGEMGAKKPRMEGSMTMTYESLLDAPQLFPMLTGMNCAEFDALCADLDSNKNLLNRFFQPKARGVAKYSPRTALFVGLTKIRLDLHNDVLSRLFGLSRNTMGLLCDGSLGVLDAHFASVVASNAVPQSQVAVWSDTPEALKASYGTPYRFAIDATEFPIYHPEDPELAYYSWSNYKHRYTHKINLGIGPNGRVQWVGKMYLGRTTDGDAIKRDELLNVLDEGDVILADKGYDALPMAFAAEKKVHLRMPDFKPGADLPKPRESHGRSAALSGARIHVERLMRAKDAALEVEDGLVVVRPHRVHVGELAKVALGLLLAHSQGVLGRLSDVGNHDGNGRRPRPLLGLDHLGGKREERLARQPSDAGRIVRARQDVHGLCQARSHDHDKVVRLLVLVARSDQENAAPDQVVRGDAAHEKVAIGRNGAVDDLLEEHVVQLRIRFSRRKDPRDVHLLQPRLQVRKHARAPAHNAQDVGPGGIEAGIYLVVVGQILLSGLLGRLPALSLEFGLHGGHEGPIKDNVQEAAPSAHAGNGVQDTRHKLLLVQPEHNGFSTCQPHSEAPNGMRNIRGWHRRRTGARRLISGLGAGFDGRGEFRVKLNRHIKAQHHVLEHLVRSGSFGDPALPQCPEGAVAHFK